MLLVFACISLQQIVAESPPVSNADYDPARKAKSKNHPLYGAALNLNPWKLLLSIVTSVQSTLLLLLLGGCDFLAP
jgi:hypothetical protein